MSEPLTLDLSIFRCPRTLLEAKRLLARLPEGQCVELTLGRDEDDVLRYVQQHNSQCRVDYRGTLCTVTLIKGV